MRAITTNGVTEYEFNTTGCPVTLKLNQRQYVYQLIVITTLYQGSPQGAQSHWSSTRDSVCTDSYYHIVPGLTTGCPFTLKLNQRQCVLLPHCTRAHHRVPSHSETQLEAVCVPVDSYYHIVPGLTTGCPVILKTQPETVCVPVDSCYHIVPGLTTGCPVTLKLNQTVCVLIVITTLYQGSPQGAHSLWSSPEIVCYYHIVPGLTTGCQATLKLNQRQCVLLPHCTRAHHRVPSHSETWPETVWVPVDSYRIVPGLTTGCPVTLNLNQRQSWNAIFIRETSWFLHETLFLLRM